MRWAGQAKAICHACPVREPCLAWALSHGISSGVWGGTTDEERRAIRSAAIRCGPGRAG
ncbi:MAG: WhiB family transcriptional regulator [Streptosporangiaceae bacterium]